MKSCLKALSKLLIKKYPLFDGCGGCNFRLMPGNFPPEPVRPIDFVFSWVSSCDPQWIRKKEGYTGSVPIASPDQENCLYRDNDELRYALRGIDLYAPWVRNVVVLTDNQVPPWLDTDHPRIRIVDHTDCIPDEYLPTFNSHVIEAHLHRIPDLSEHFVYCNDDFFLLRPSSPADFFTANGLPYMYVDWRGIRRWGYRKPTPHAASYANTRQWLEIQGITPAPDPITAHVPYPMTRTTMGLAYEFYGERVERFGRNRFRTTDDLAFTCHAVPLWAYVRKRTVPRDVPYYYINAKRFDRQTYYDVMLRDKETGTLPLFLCLNDVGDVPEGHTWQRDMGDFLRAYYPHPSAFERGGG